MHKWNTKQCYDILPWGASSASRLHQFESMCCHCTMLPRSLWSWICMSNKKQEKIGYMSDIGMCYLFFAIPRNNLHFCPPHSSPTSQITKQCISVESGPLIVTCLAISHEWNRQFLTCGAMSSGHWLTNEYLTPGLIILHGAGKY
jgi:hypothetical protein